ncbi:MAG: acetate--CoA ligase family protein [Candidatus Heimdallarchaeaceae archaeon]|jgi:acetyl-CoA synthetase (ADP-forming)
MNEKIKQILNQAKIENRTILNYEESRKVMELSNIPLNRMIIAKDLEEASRKAEEIGYPIVLKIVSKDIVHKSDMGGVKVGINSQNDLKTSYNEMMREIKKITPNAHIEGVSIEEMVKGIELLIGTNTDEQFGKMIALGVGGIFVEVYEDVSFRLIPVNEKDIQEMISEIRGNEILDGFRGMPAVNKQELISFLLNVSKLIEENTIIKEMDLNPVVATKDGLKAIDARIILE